MKNTSSIFTEWLVLGCQQGDKKAFNLLVKNWHKKVLCQAYWYSKNSIAAKDISQEVWTSVVNGLGKLKDPALFPVWLNRIIYRKAVDWIRETQKERSLNIYEAKESLYPGATDNDAKVKIMMKHLQRLPVDQKIILTLFYLKGHSIFEIGEILGVPVGTVKSRLFNAREHLKKKLKTNEYEKS